MSRLIPLLTVQNGQLVKTKQFNFYKYMGDPVNAVRIYGKLAVDELIILDISENYEEENILRMLNRISERALMPITYGGHITSFEFAEKVFSIGFDRIVLRRGLRKKETTKKIIETYGASSVTACFDVEIIDEKLVKLNEDKYEHSELHDFLEEIKKTNFGQILFNYRQKDGMRFGLEKDFLIEAACDRLVTPIIVAGGCKSKEEAYRFMLENSNISVAASSIFTLIGPNDAVLIRF